MSETFLRVEVHLLLAKYGRGKVLSELASLTDVTVESIEQEIAAIEAMRKTPKKRSSGKPAKLPDLLSRSNYPELVENLMGMYQRRTFLPNVRTVQQFLTAAGVSPTPKTREAAMRRVFEVLVRLDGDKLGELINDAQKDTGTGEFSLLADQIMQNTRRGE
jgi:hypothetical protein